MQQRAVHMTFKRFNRHECCCPAPTTPLAEWKGKKHSCVKELFIRHYKIPVICKKKSPPCLLATFLLTIPGHAL
jgi:hypothetical protein